MWWSRALLLFAVLALGPTGCGFRPMYGVPSGPASSVDANLAAIRVGPIKDRIGQQLRNALVQRLFTEDANVRNVKAFFSVKRGKFDPSIQLPKLPV